MTLLSPQIYEKRDHEIIFSHPRYHKSLSTFSFNDLELKLTSADRYLQSSFDFSDNYKEKIIEEIIEEVSKQHKCNIIEIQAIEDACERDKQLKIYKENFIISFNSMILFFENDFDVIDFISRKSPALDVDFEGEICFEWYNKSSRANIAFQFDGKLKLSSLINNKFNYRKIDICMAQNLVKYEIVKLFKV